MLKLRSLSFQFSRYKASKNFSQQRSAPRPVPGAARFRSCAAGKRSFAARAEGRRSGVEGRPKAFDPCACMVLRAVASRPCATDERKQDLFRVRMLMPAGREERFKPKRLGGRRDWDDSPATDIPARQAKRADVGPSRRRGRVRQHGHAFEGHVSPEVVCPTVPVAHLEGLRPVAGQSRSVPVADVVVHQHAEQPGAEQDQKCAQRI